MAARDDLKPSAIGVSRKELFSSILKDLLTCDDDGVPSNADKGSPSSCAIARALVAKLGKPKTAKKLDGQTLGKFFEVHVTSFVESTFPFLEHLRPGDWTVARKHELADKGITAFDQYSHLAKLVQLMLEHPELEASLGSDYLIKPDVMIFRKPMQDSAINVGRKLVDERVARMTSLREVNTKNPTLHASISCKWTIRSDRSQNSRSEALNLIRNRKGKLPHISVVTAEPLPSRIASIALGTGDIDCVYHLCLNELIEVVQKSKYEDALDTLNVMVEGNRLRDISDLPLDLVI